nr:hypothetical protein DOP62_07925 [Synechococcus elongatus PCC 11801]
MSNAVLDRPAPAASTTSLDRLKSLYSTDHQAELLVLQAEVETLLCQIHSLKGRNSSKIEGLN